MHAIAACVSSPTCSLVHLCLSSSRLNDESLILLSSALASNASLTRVDLNNNNFGRDGMKGRSEREQPSGCAKPNTHHLIHAIQYCVSFKMLTCVHFYDSI